MYSISIFILHFTYLWGAYAPNAPPYLRACKVASQSHALCASGHHTAKSSLIKSRLIVVATSWRRKTATTITRIIILISRKLFFHTI